MADTSPHADAPPRPRYRLTVVVEGNTIDELDSEMHTVASSFYPLDVLHPVTREPRDAFEVVGGRSTVRLEHRNPEMTPKRYADELAAWFARRKEVRRRG